MVGNQPSQGACRSLALLLLLLVGNALAATHFERARRDGVVKLPVLSKVSVTFRMGTSYRLCTGKLALELRRRLSM